MSSRTSHNREWKDRYTLLCEQCGYVLEGLDQDGPCPECGKPIEESLPERRIGTPWQQAPGFKSLMKTWWMTLRHPIRTFEAVSFTGTRWLTTITIGISSLIASSGWLLPILFSMKNPAYEIDRSSLIQLWINLILMCATVLFISLNILTYIETKGLRFLGNRKDFRISPEVAKSITAHGSVGWLLCAIGLCFSQFIGTILVYLYTPDLGPEPDVFFLFFVNGLPQWVNTTYLMLYMLVLPGFFYFEIFAYLGLRRCKYANSIRE